MQLRSPLLVCREFVVNVVSHWMLEAANVTCGDFEHNESEWEAANLTPLPSLKVISRCKSDLANPATNLAVQIQPCT